jgi:hypothetical protein
MKYLGLADTNTIDGNEGNTKQKNLKGDDRQVSSGRTGAHKNFWGYL